MCSFGEHSESLCKCFIHCFYRTFKQHYIPWTSENVEIYTVSLQLHCSVLLCNPAVNNSAFAVKAFGFVSSCSYILAAPHCWENAVVISQSAGKENQCAEGLGGQEVEEIHPEKKCGHILIASSITLTYYCVLWPLKWFPWQVSWHWCGVEPCYRLTELCCYTHQWLVMVWKEGGCIGGSELVP